MVNPTERASNAEELLETKLFVPRWQPEMISRPRLVELLRSGVEQKLTLISAPAGFGKTTLIAEWLYATRSEDRATGWVSLDQSDNDPGAFWRYVLAALAKVDANVAERARAMLNASESDYDEPMLTRLINDLAASESTIHLVLDDFHVIEARPIHQAVEFLVLNQPPQLHIIIASRSDPPLPLVRLRGRGEVSEIRAADLRFAASEVDAFLNDLMKLRLSSADTAILESRTEGWIAGLQLAALSLRGREDVHEFIREFAGDDRYIVDYLVEEVLRRQPARTQRFLLQTSILDKLCGPLCDAVVDGEDSQFDLETLESANVFVVPLDGRRRWYRYHHLFADVLQAHAVQEHAEEIPAWHLKASVWFEKAGLPGDAIRHALAASDYARAAELVELAWRPMDRTRQAPTWLTWAKKLPPEHIILRPVLSAGYAWALLEEGSLEAGNAWLEVAQEGLNDLDIPVESVPDASKESRVADAVEFQHLPATIAAARAFHALAVNDVVGAAKHARLSLDLLPKEEHWRRSSPGALLALASWTRGDLDQASQSLAGALAGAYLLDNTRFIINGTYVLGEILRGVGRFVDAERGYDQALQSPATQTAEWVPSTADLYTGRSELHLMRNELEAAGADLQRSKDLGEDAGLAHWRHRWFVACAGLQEARGDFQSALEMLDLAAQEYARGPVPDVRPIAAYRIRILIRMGRTIEAEDAARDLRLASTPDASYMTEYEGLTLARLTIALRRSGRSDLDRSELSQLLDRVLAAAIQQRRITSQIEVLALRSLASDAFAEGSPALAPLKRALELAEPPGYTRVFLTEGQPMRDLLRTALATGTSVSLLPRLLAAFDELLDAETQVSRSGAEQYVEPLTERERDVMRLIAAGMHNREIADELFISLSTVKRHIANAYGKLGASNRTEAVARAIELDLLNPHFTAEFSVAPPTGRTFPNRRLTTIAGGYPLAPIRPRQSTSPLYTPS